MAQYKPLSFKGAAPDFTGVRQLTITDTLEGVVNHLDFSDGSVMVKSELGVVSPVTLTANTFLGNIGSDLAAVTTADMQILLEVPLSLEELLSDLTGTYTEGQSLTFNAISGAFEARDISLASLTDVSAVAATDGDELLFTSGTWGPAAPRYKMVVAPEQTANFTASISTLYPVDTRSGVVAILPPTAPEPGDYFIVADSRGNSSVAEITIRFSQTSQVYHSLPQDSVIQVSEASTRYIYTGPVVGWISETQGTPASALVGPGLSNILYTHTQAVASTIWTVNHNLNTRPNISVVDAAGTQVLANIAYLDDNTIQVIHGYPLTGSAYCS